MSLILSLSILPDNLCLLFTLHHHLPETEKKFELAELFFSVARTKKKNMWSCATTDIGKEAIVPDREKKFC